MDQLWTPWRYAYVSQADTKDTRPGVPPELAGWPGDLHCVFCNMHHAVAYAIAQGTDANQAERAAGIVVRGQTCFICLNAYPYSTGHVMIVPYVHQSFLGRLAPEAAQEMMAMAQRTTLVLEQSYRPDGVNLGMNLGQAAGAGVAEHLHLHALPRWAGDTNFMTTVGETRVLPEALPQTWQRLRDAFAQR